jgi:hypothetical protein
MSMHIPEGYGTVPPYFIVADAERFVDFLEEVFDAKEISRAEMNGRIANVHIRIGTSTFMISDGSEEGLGTMKGAYYIVRGGCRQDLPIGLEAANRRRGHGRAVTWSR